MADGRLTLGAAVFEQDGDAIRSVSTEESAADVPEAIGGRVAAALLGMGAAAMLHRMRAGTA
jgi:porphobilinogen deaminase